MNFCFTVGLLAVVTLCISAATTSESHPSETTAVAETVTTALGIGTENPPTKFPEFIDLNLNQRSGVVTVEFNDVTNNNDAGKSHATFPGVIVKILNSAKLKGGTIPEIQFRRRRREADRYNEDGIVLVQIEPAILNDRLRISFAAQDEGGNVLKAKTLEQTLKNSTGVIEREMNQSVHTVYTGLPVDIKEALAAADRRPTVWEEHRMMFIVVAIVIAIAIVTLILCLFCFYCCQGKPNSSDAKDELSPKKQPPVEDMIEVTPVVPLQYAPISQQYPTPTTEASPAIEEENGWIVPIDQLSPEELEQPDVQISKL